MGRPAWVSGPQPEDAVLAGDLNGKGIYYTLLRWYPGYMSALHYYATDRLCVVVSETWWANSGADLIPATALERRQEVPFSRWPAHRITTALSPAARNPR
jgi:hypothetical protein